MERRKAIFWGGIAVSTYFMALGIYLFNAWAGWGFSNDAEADQALWGMIRACAYIFIGGWGLVFTGLLTTRQTERNPRSRFNE